jgi:hypothetical protein
MPVEAQLATINVGQSYLFTFSQLVGPYVVGVCHFDFRFPDFTPHKILEIALSVGSNQPGPNGIQVTVNGTMKDQSGNNLDPTASTATVMILAWSQGDAFATVGVATGVVNGSASPPIALPPGAAIQASQAILTGFDVASGDGSDHNLQLIKAGASSNLSNEYNEPPQVTIGSMVAMQDASGHVAVAPTINGAYFCQANDPEIEVVPWSGSGAVGSSPMDWATAKVPLTQPATAAALFLTGFALSYPDGVDHWVADLAVGCPNITLLDNGSTAMFYPYAATMDGDVFNDKCNVTYGTVSFVVVGIP